jgi:hypothetical protein
MKTNKKEILAAAVGVAVAGMAYAQTEITASGIRALAPIDQEAVSHQGWKTLDGSGLVGYSGYGTGTINADGEASRYNGPTDYGLILDLGAIYSFSNLQFWNGNYTGYTNRGIRTANFLVSNDGKTWTSASFTTDAGSGNTFDQGTGAAGFAGNQITFSGSPQGRYLKIQPTATYGGSVIDIGEVRAFGSYEGAYSEPAGAKLSIAVATASDTQIGRVPSRIVDGTGLTGQGHDALSTGVWLGLSSVTPQFAQFDLGASTAVGAMKVWNYNENTAVNRGMRTVDILVSDDPTFSTCTTVLDNYELLPGAMQAGYLPQIINIPSPVSGRYLRITTAGNTNPRFTTPIGGLTYIGLSEVQLFQAPPTLGTVISIQ